MSKNSQGSEWDNIAAQHPGKLCRPGQVKSYDPPISNSPSSEEVCNKSFWEEARLFCYREPWWGLDFNMNFHVASAHHTQNCLTTQGKIPAQWQPLACSTPVGLPIASYKAASGWFGDLVGVKMMGTQGGCLAKGQRVIEMDQKLEGDGPGEGGRKCCRGEVIKGCIAQTNS